MRCFIGILMSLLLMLQYRLWIGEGSYGHQLDLLRSIAEQKAENERLRQRNAKIAAEVSDLKSGLDSVEERARKDLGMIKRGETFYMVIEQDQSTANQAASGSDEQ
jgi:cell division protein FtsB